MPRIKTHGTPAALDAPPPFVELVRALYGLSEDSVYLSPAPLHFRMTMRLGGTAVVMERFDSLELLRAIERYRVTHVQLVPTMFVRMLKLPPELRHAHDLSTLRCAIRAAAPCPIPVKEHMI